jgi:hypothetical protein
MTKIADHHRVSSSFLARVCKLNLELVDAHGFCDRPPLHKGVLAISVD